MKAHIIVIEDNSDTARMVLKLLKKRGHEVETFATGEEGLLALFNNVPDLILIDLGLPDIDGQTVIALLRQQTTLLTTPIIAFTAWSPEVARKMADAYGCNGVITKPLDTRTFVAQIEAFLRDGTAEDGNEEASDEQRSTS